VPYQSNKTPHYCFYPCLEVRCGATYKCHQRNSYSGQPACPLPEVRDDAAHGAHKGGSYSGRHRVPVLRQSSNPFCSGPFALYGLDYLPMQLGSHGVQSFCIEFAG
jgi:hypothetical protein